MYLLTSFIENSEKKCLSGISKELSPHKDTLMNRSKDTPLWNLLFNIVLPVIILNKAHSFFPSNGALYSLIIALSFPLAYGVTEYVKAKTVNMLSIIGLVSIILTGGLALMKLEGIFFAIKEALIPLIIALVILGSLFYKKPLMYLILIKSSAIKSQIILSRIKDKENEIPFNKLMKMSTFWLAGSFLLSAILNFIIAVFVFTNISPEASSNQKSQILNEQIADMTWMGYVMIALPLSILMAVLIWYIIKHLKKLTGLKLEDMINV